MNWKHNGSVTLLFLTCAVFLMFSHAMPAMGEEPTSYLCIPDLSTGFMRNESGKWVETSFNVEGEKYLLSKKEGKWYWNLFGDPTRAPHTECGAFDGKGFIECGTVMTYTFNKNTLRFIGVYPIGYVFSSLEEEKIIKATPYISIGTCSPL